MNCQDCGACCAHAGDSAVASSNRIHRLPPLVRLPPTANTICIALQGPIGGPCGCSIYERRPPACREFTAGTEECFDTRRIAGL